MITKFLSVSAAALMLATPALAQSTTTTPPTTQQQAPSTTTQPAPSTAQQMPSANQQPGSTTTGNIQFIQTQQRDQWLASHFMDRTVYDMEGNSVGDVNDVLIGRDGSVMAVIVGVGGFLGIGEKDVAVPFERFQLQPAANRSNDRNANTNATNTPSTTTSVTNATAPAMSGGDNMWGDRNARLVLRTTRDELRNAPSFEEWSDRAAARNTNSNTDGNNSTARPPAGTTTTPAR
jgi:sporulation protein YlmC with PRC-barrel domain